MNVASMTKNLLAVALMSMAIASCGSNGSSGSDASSPSAPTNPANTNFTGTWTGTLTRPSGLGSISVRWVGTQGDQGVLSGPFSMTYNGATIQASFDGQFGGGSNQPPMIFFRIHLDAGASSVSPSCSIVSNSTISGFGTAATSLTSSTFDVTYNSCQGFIANDAQRTQHVDSGSVLTLTKQ